MDTETKKGCVSFATKKKGPDIFVGPCWREKQQKYYVQDPNAPKLRGKRSVDLLAKRIFLR